MGELNMKNISLKEKMKNDGAGFIMLYNHLIWFFSNKNKYLNGFSRVDAEVLSFIIDIESLNTANDSKSESGYFMCTSSFINYRLEYTETTIFKSIKRLRDFGIINAIVRDGKRYVKINEKVMYIILHRFNEYEEELKEVKFSNLIQNARDLESERNVYDKYTYMVIEDIKRETANE